MSPPKFALVRPLGGDEKSIAEVEDIYFLSNYELTKFSPKHSKSFSMSQLYGWKKMDGSGVNKIIKCRIILMRESQKLIDDELKKGKLPRCEPSRFEDSIKTTEDFSLFELVKEKSIVKSTSKSASSVKTSNRSLSKLYVDSNPSTSTSHHKTVDLKITQDDEEIQKQERTENSLKSDVINPTKPKSREKSEAAHVPKDKKVKKDNKSGDEGKPSNKDEKKGTHKRKSSENSFDEYLKEMKVPKIIRNDDTQPTDSVTVESTSEQVHESSNDGISVVKPHEPAETNLDWSKLDNSVGVRGTVENYQPEKTLDHSVKAKVSPLGKPELEDSACHSSPCCSATLHEMNKILKTFADEVAKLKEMNLTLTTALKDFTDKNVSGFAQILPSSTELKVDLGGSKCVSKDWAEKVVWTGSEPLKWKIDQILRKIFKDNELLHFWFDRTRIRESEGDKVFPEECVTLLEEFIDETNLKKAKLEIIKRQAKIRKVISDQELCDQKCQEAHAEVMMELEPVTKAEVRKQIGKVLYDAKAAERKAIGKTTSERKVSV